MTKPKGEDQILDYIYHELSGDELAAFERRLSEEPELRAEVESFSRVREAYKQTRTPRPLGATGPAATAGQGMSQEAAQRMTALLMQEATAAVGKSAEPSGGGKLLTLKPRSVRRMFMGPASGIFAAAAAALFWVVFRTQSPPTPAPAPTSSGPAVSAPVGSTAIIGLPEGSAPATVPVQKQLLENEAKEQAAAAPLDVTAKPGELARGPMPARDDAPATGQAVGGMVPLETATTRRAAPAKSQAAMPAAGDGLAAKGSGRASQSWTGWKTEGKPVAAEPAAPAPAPAEPAYASKKTAAAEADKDSRFAAPPPPPPPPAASQLAEAERGGLDEVIESGKARRKAKVVEDLADQELAGMPRGGSAGKAERPPAEKQAEQRNQNSDYNRYAQAYRGREEQATSDSAGAAATQQQGYSNYGYPATPSAAPPAVAAPMPAASTPTLNQAQSHYAGESNALSLVVQVQDALRRGRCDEAAELLRKAEGTASARLIPEARTAYEQKCASKVPGNLNLQAPATPEAVAPAPMATERQFAPAPRRAISPSVQQAYGEKAAKSADSRASLPVAKPAPAKAKRASKADTAVAY